MGRYCFSVQVVSHNISQKDLKMFAFVLKPRDYIRANHSPIQFEIAEYEILKLTISNFISQCDNHIKKMIRNILYRIVNGSFYSEQCCQKSLFESLELSTNGTVPQKKLRFFSCDTLYRLFVTTISEEISFFLTNNLNQIVCSEISFESILTFEFHHIALQLARELKDNFIF